MTCVLDYGKRAPATMNWFGVQVLDDDKVRLTGPSAGHCGVKLFLKPISSQLPSVSVIFR